MDVDGVERLLNLFVDSLPRRSTMQRVSVTEVSGTEGDGAPVLSQSSSCCRSQLVTYLTREFVDYAVAINLGLAIATDHYFVVVDGFHTTSLWPVLVLRRLAQFHLCYTNSG
jgi:hypothetical protein